jgi:hypothetical protein
MLNTSLYSFEGSDAPDILPVLRLPLHISSTFMREHKRPLSLLHEEQSGVHLK